MFENAKLSVQDIDLDNKINDILADGHLKEQIEALLEEYGGDEVAKNAAILALVENATDEDFVECMKANITFLLKYIIYIQTVDRYHKKKNKLYEKFLKEGIFNGENRN